VSTIPEGDAVGQLSHASWQASTALVPSELTTLGLQRAAGFSATQEHLRLLFLECDQVELSLHVKPPRGVGWMVGTGVVGAFEGAPEGFCVGE